MKSFFYVLAFLIPSFALGQDVQELIDNKDFTQVITKIERLGENGILNEDMYYNLGMAYYEIGNLGKAIQNLEKTLKMDPNHEEAKHNLVLMNLEKKDEFGVIPEFFLKKWWNAMFLFTSSMIWSVLSLVFLWLLILAIVANWKRILSWEKQNLNLLVLGFGFLFLLTIFLARSKAIYERNPSHAVILKKETVIKQSPTGASPNVVPIHMGTKVLILDKINDWLKIKLTNGETGWLPKDELGEI